MVLGFGDYLAPGSGLDLEHEDDDSVVDLDREDADSVDYSDQI